jgi:hypothetical protein
MDSFLQFLEMRKNTCETLPLWPMKFDGLSDGWPRFYPPLTVQAEAPTLRWLRAAASVPSMTYNAAISQCGQIFQAELATE